MIQNKIARVSRRMRGLSTMVVLVIVSLCLTQTGSAQTTQAGKKISNKLFGLFFEDINYSADGGLYA